MTGILATADTVYRAIDLYIQEAEGFGLPPLLDVLEAYMIAVPGDACAKPLFVLLSAAKQ
jgi:hypothetical protein